MKKSEFILLNNVIRKIYCEENYRQMRQDFLNMMIGLIPAKRCTFFLGSGDPDHLCDPVTIGVSKNVIEEYISDKEYVRSDPTKWHFMRGTSVVYRETDLFPDNIREETEYFQFVYGTGELYYSLQMGISYAGKFLGVISFFRGKEQGDFTDDELFLFELVKDHLEYRCNQEWNKANGKVTAADEKGLNIHRFIIEYGLTVREGEVLEQLFAGQKVTMICEKLAISESTLKKHTLSIYKKLNINNRWELIRFK